jgi:L-alanine-DL-glutamate epimerase-like enolase superfamily enzyme
VRGVERIRELRTAAYRVPLEEPESDGTLTWDHTGVVVVHVVAGDHVGLGFTYGPGACRAVIDELLVDVVRGRDPDDVVGAWDAMVRAVRNAGRPGVVSMAIAAVDVALWDLKARRSGLALASLLGRVREAVPIYGSGGFTSMDEANLVDQMRSFVHDQGIPRVKMKIATGWGAHPARDLDRIAAVRDAIGPDAELYVDANGGYTRKAATRVGHALRATGATWFEEPVSSDDLAGLREVRDAIDADVAAGEYGYHLAYFGQMCATGAVDVVQADVSRCAGITEWLRVAAVAAAHGLQISGHCAPALHAHVAAAVPNLRHVEYFADHVRVDHLLFGGVLEPVDGALVPDTRRGGHGLMLRDDAAERYRVG